MRIEPRTSQVYLTKLSPIAANKPLKRCYSGLVFAARSRQLGNHSLARYVCYQLPLRPHIKLRHGWHWVTQQMLSWLGNSRGPSYRHYALVLTRWCG